MNHPYCAFDVKFFSSKLTALELQEKIKKDLNNDKYSSESIEIEISEHAMNCTEDYCGESKNAHGELK